MTVHRTNFLTLSLLLLWLFFSTSQVFSEENKQETAIAANEGGLDSIWKDEAVEKNAASAASSNLSTKPEKANSNEAVRPLCGLDEFLDSDFVRSNPWPILGPFKALNSSEPHILSDAAHNRLNLSVQDNHITSLELELLGEGNGSRQFINMEMAIDFLCEGLGVKQSKIHELNSDLETNIDQITGKEAKKFKCAVEPVLVRIEPIVSDNEGQNKGYRINVASNSKSPSVVALKQASKDLEEEPTTTKQLASANIPYVSKNESEQATVPQNNTSLGATPAVKSDQKPPSNSIDKDAALKQEFAAFIKHWQQIKKTAIRQAQGTELSEILSGAALAQQTAAVNWLSANHRYYDMTPVSVNISHLSPIVADKKYLVTCQLKEHRKFVDGSTGHVLQESDESNNVIYTIKKVGNHWLIEDSKIVKTPAK